MAGGKTPVRALLLPVVVCLALCGSAPPAMAAGRVWSGVSRLWHEAASGALKRLEARGAGLPHEIVAAERRLVHENGRVFFGEPVSDGVPPGVVCEVETRQAGLDMTGDVTCNGLSSNGRPEYMCLGFLATARDHHQGVPSASQ